MATLTPPDGASTIFALSSAPGRAGVSVFRVSGPKAKTVLETMTGKPLPLPRQASLRMLIDPANDLPLDQALCLWFPAPHSFTGEDVVEFHSHGSLAVRTAILRILATQPGCRAADPGEFTRRAFTSGKLDLSAVEGLSDLIEAETEAQRKQALRQLGGALARQIDEWRDAVIDILAGCEAALDFSDEGDVPSDVAAQAVDRISVVAASIRSALVSARRGERVRSGYHVVITGAPNAGKSTLLNAIARRDVAIVSPIPGTTRDAIELRCDLDGLPVTFVDTAGLRESNDPIERMGIDRALERAADADLVLGLSPSDEAEITTERVLPADIPSLLVRTKIDLVELPVRDVVLRPCDGTYRVSAVTGDGVDALLNAIKARLLSSDGGLVDPVVTRERHRVALGATLECLDRAANDIPGEAVELLAEELRLALRHLGRITGEVDVEDVLDRIFADFCIGK